MLQSAFDDRDRFPELYLFFIANAVVSVGIALLYAVVITDLGEGYISEGDKAWAQVHAVVHWVLALAAIVDFVMWHEDKPRKYSGSVMLTYCVMHFGWMLYWWDVFNITLEADPLCLAVFLIPLGIDLVYFGYLLNIILKRRKRDNPGAS